MTAAPHARYERDPGADTAERTCLCSALAANVGLGQTRRDGYHETALVTLGADLDGATELLAVHTAGWTAAQAVDDVRGWLRPRHSPCRDRDARERPTREFAGWSETSHRAAMWSLEISGLRFGRRPERWVGMVELARTTSHWDSHTRVDQSVRVTPRPPDGRRP